MTKVIAPSNKARQSSDSYGSRGHRRPELTITTVQKTILVQKTSLRVEKHFTESCLPKTKAIGFESSELLLPLLRSYPSSWSFIDKVVVMLVPDCLQHVEEYYANEGKRMEEMYPSSQIQYIDQLLARDLCKKIEDLKNGLC
ncbi:MAG: hypothetical protein IPL32_14505 [Chloracidobacterium sp.]|nr:hypothetical protein [Chloracidobacterium sp.]